MCCYILLLLIINKLRTIYSYQVNSIIKLKAILTIMQQASNGLKLPISAKKKIDNLDSNKTPL